MSFNTHHLYTMTPPLPPLTYPHILPIFWHGCTTNANDNSSTEATDINFYATITDEDIKSSVSDKLADLHICNRCPCSSHTIIYISIWRLKCARLVGTRSLKDFFTNVMYIVKISTPSTLSKSKRNIWVNGNKDYKEKEWWGLFKSPKQMKCRFKE